MEACLVLELSVQYLLNGTSVDWKGTINLLTTLEQVELFQLLYTFSARLSFLGITHTATNFTPVFLKTQKFSCVQPITTNRYPLGDLLWAQLLSISPTVFLLWLILICFITSRQHDRIERIWDLESKHMNCNSAVNLLASWSSANHLSSRAQVFSFERGMELEVGEGVQWKVPVLSPFSKGVRMGWDTPLVMWWSLVFYPKPPDQVVLEWALAKLYLQKTQNETTALANETLSQTEYNANQSSLPLTQDGSKT